jgi:UDP-3-O-[3-hydroxymyristoyl] glucosamine N-acyltransferase
VKLSVIAGSLGCMMPEGADDVEISRISSPEDADERSITFIADPRYRAAIERCAAAAVLVGKGAALPGRVCLEVSDPYCAFAKTGQLFEDTAPLFDGPIHPTACIHPSAHVHETACVGPFSVVGKACEIGEGTAIGAHCVIENGTTIGSRCRIDSGAIIRRECRIADRVIIQSLAVIGSEGFGNARENGVWIRIPSFGTVIIEEGAEIGAGTMVDRGALGSTVIGRGVKIDNLCHIAHNVEIGENCGICAQTGISGSTKLGKRVGMYGQVGTVGHITIGDDAVIGAKAGVSNSVDPGAFVTGYPARDLMTMRRIEAAQSKLPELLKEVRRLRKELEALKINSSAGET